MPQAYDFLAEWFEYLNDDCDYPAWSQYFIDGLNRLGAGKVGLELGCGSGAFSRALTRAGFSMTGVDCSVPMLNKASDLALKEGLNLRFVQGNAQTIRTPEKYDFILSPNDCYNYLAPESLPQAFKRASACLKKGGVFWFDISSACKLAGKVANNTMVDDRDGVTYLSFNHQVENQIEMEVTLFVRGKDGKYTRYDETHTQYIHREEEVLSALESAGFTVLAVEGHLGTPKENSDRLNFICRK